MAHNFDISAFRPPLIAHIPGVPLLRPSLLLDTRHNFKFYLGIFRLSILPREMQRIALLFCRLSKPSNLAVELCKGRRCHLRLSHEAYGLRQWPHTLIIYNWLRLFNLYINRPLLAVLAAAAAQEAAST